MTAGLADRLVAYIERFDAGFSSRIRPVDGALLAEFEGLAGSVPEEFRDYLGRMGGDAGGFQLFSDEETPFSGLVGLYRASRELPRGASILIARGTDIHLALDGRNSPARRVAEWDGREYSPRADSLESHLLQQAWWQYAGKGLGSSGWPALRGGDAVFRKAVAAAGARGLEPLGFSDGAHRFFEGERRGLAVELRPDGQVLLHARAASDADAAALAGEVAAESGGRPI